MKFLKLLLFTFAFGFSNCLFAYDKIEDRAGKIVEGEVLSYTEGKIVVRLALNNELIEIPIKNVSKVTFHPSLEAIYPKSKHYKMISSNGRAGSEDGQLIICKFKQIHPIAKGAKLFLDLHVGPNGSKNTLKIYVNGETVGSFRGNPSKKQSIALNANASEILELTIVNHNSDACGLRAIYKNRSFTVPNLILRVVDTTKTTSEPNLVEPNLVVDPKVTESSIAVELLSLFNNGDFLKLKNSEDNVILKVLNKTDEYYILNSSVQPEVKYVKTKCDIEKNWLKIK